MIRRATMSDLTSLADIHIAALPNDLLPHLGRRFLIGTFYPTILRSERAFTIVNEENGTVNAFVIFAYQSQDLTHEVSKDKASLAVHFICNFFRDPRLLKEAISFFQGFRTQLEVELNESLETLPELYLIATDPMMQSKGIGTKIVQMGLEVLVSQGYRKSVVKTSSDRAKDFYLRQGYQWIGFEYRQKRKLHILLYDSQPKAVP